MQKLQKLKLGLSELHIIQGEVASQADGGEGDDEDLVFEEEAYYYNWKELIGLISKIWILTFAYQICLFLIPTSSVEIIIKAREKAAAEADEAAEAAQAAQSAEGTEGGDDKPADGEGEMMMAEEEMMAME